MNELISAAKEFLIESEDLLDSGLFIGDKPTSYLAALEALQWYIDEALD
jgi:hypothetical protein